MPTQITARTVPDSIELLSEGCPLREADLTGTTDRSLSVRGTLNFLLGKAESGVDFSQIPDMVKDDDSGCSMPNETVPAAKSCLERIAQGECSMYQLAPEATAIVLRSLQEIGQV